jgi:hypothetical protein
LQPKALPSVAALLVSPRGRSGAPRGGSRNGILGKSAVSECVAEARYWCGFRTGDVNADGIVDAADLALVLGSWGLPGATDLDGNGTTNAADIGVLLGNWG